MSNGCNAALGRLVGTRRARALTVKLRRNLIGEVDFLDLDTFTHLKTNKGRHFSTGTRHQLADGNIRVLDEGLLYHTVFCQEFLDPSANHLFDNFSRLAGFLRLGSVDLLLLGDDLSVRILTTLYVVNTWEGDRSKFRNQEIPTSASLAAA